MVAVQQLTTQLAPHPFADQADPLDRAFIEQGQRASAAAAPLARFEGDGGNLYLYVTSGTDEPLPAGLDVAVSVRRYQAQPDAKPLDLLPRSVLGDEGYTWLGTVPEKTLLLARATVPGYSTWTRCFMAPAGLIKCISLTLYPTDEAPDLLRAYPDGDLVMTDDLDHLVTPEPLVAPVMAVEAQKRQAASLYDKPWNGPKHSAEFTKPQTDPKKRKAARRAASKARRR